MGLFRFPHPKNHTSVELSLLFLFFVASGCYPSTTTTGHCEILIVALSMSSVVFQACFRDWERYLELTVRTVRAIWPRHKHAVKHGFLDVVQILVTRTRDTDPPDNHMWERRLSSASERCARLAIAAFCIAHVS
jgi:hypothetical protein